MNSAVTNQENIENLLRLIRRSVKVKRFALIFANCNSLASQAQYTEEIRIRCFQSDVIVSTVELWGREPLSDLRPVIWKQLKQDFPEGLPSKIAIQITGLEISILLDTDERFPSVLQTLNIGRESYRSEFPHPFIIWLPDYAYIKLASVAPDFWSVRDGSFTFEDDATDESLSDLDLTIPKRNDITRWRDKTGQITLIERIIGSKNKKIPPENLTDLQLKLGDAYYFLRRRSEAQTCFEEALKLGRKIESPERVGSALNGLGLIYTDLGEYVKAIELFKKYLELKQEQSKFEAQAVGYNHLGLTYDKQGNYEQAISAYQKALEINEAFGKRKAEGDVLGNLGLVHRKLGHFEEALRFHHEALKISREVGDYQSELKDLEHIGLVYHTQREHVQAIRYYTQALELSQRIGNKSDEFDLQLNLGDSWRNLHEYKQARIHYNAAHQLAKEIKDENLLLMTTERLLDLYSPYNLDDFDKEISLIKRFAEWGVTTNIKGIQLLCADKLLELCSRQDLALPMKHEWLLTAASLLRKLLKEADATEHPPLYEKLITIFKELGGHDEKIRGYQQKLDQLRKSQQLHIWLKPNTVEVEDGQLILQIQQSYSFFIQVGPPINEYAWIYHRDFHYAVLKSKLNRSARESFKISTETSESSTEDETETKIIENTRKTNTQIVKQSSISPKKGVLIFVKKLFSALFTRQPKHDSRNQMFRPLPSGNLKEGGKTQHTQPTSSKLWTDRINGSEIMAVVSLKFQGENISFDASEKELLLHGMEYSSILQLQIVPEKAGLKQITIEVNTTDHKLHDQFEIPLRVYDTAVNSTDENYTEQEVFDWLKDEEAEHIFLLDQWCRTRPKFIIELLCAWVNTSEPISESVFESNLASLRPAVLPVAKKMSTFSVMSILNLLRQDDSLWKMYVSTASGGVIINLRSLPYILIETIFVIGNKYEREKITKIIEKTRVTIGSVKQGDMLENFRTETVLELFEMLPPADVRMRLSFSNEQAVALWLSEWDLKKEEQGLPPISTYWLRQLPAARAFTLKMLLRGVSYRRFYEEEEGDEKAQEGHYTIEDVMTWLKDGENFEYLDLSQSRLAGINLNEVNLKGTSFQDADLRNSTFVGATLEQANLEHADLRNSRFINANLHQASMKTVQIEGTNFTDANLREADLSGAIGCDSAKFINADLRGANLSDSSLKRSELEKVGAKIDDGTTGLE